MDGYALLYLTWVTNKVLLYRQGTRLNVTWQPRWKGSLKNMYMYKYESLCCPPETIITLLISYTPT